MKLNENDAPDGYVAVEVECQGCDLEGKGLCHNGCMPDEREDNFNVIFKKKES